MNSSLAYLFITISLIYIQYTCATTSNNAVEKTDSSIDQEQKTNTVFVFKNLDESCKSSFECATACCTGDKCQNLSECESIITKAYIISAIAAVLVIAFSVMYLVFQLRKTRKNVIDIKAKIEKNKIEVKERLSKIQSENKE
jgi:cell division protein FtsL